MNGFTDTADGFSLEAIQQLQADAESIYIDMQPPSGSQNTTWGFIPFTVPGESVSVTAGESIQDAIDSLTAGGTVTLLSGTHNTGRITVPENTVIQGEGSDSTFVTVLGTPEEVFYVHGGSTPNGKTNFIIRDMHIDATGVTQRGILFAYGVGNCLFENLIIDNAFNSGIVVNNSGQVSDYYTFRNVEVLNGCEDHGINLRFATSAVFDSCTFHDLGNINTSSGMGFDCSSVSYIEVVNINSYNNITYGGKVVNCNYFYMHDSVFTDNHYCGFRIYDGTEDGISFPAYVHLEDITVDNCELAFADWGDPTTYTIEDIVINNLTLINNVNPDNSNEQNYIALKGFNVVNEYAGSLGLCQPSAGSIGTTNQYLSGTTPLEDGIGWTSWTEPTL